MHPRHPMAKKTPGPGRPGEVGAGAHSDKPVKVGGELYRKIKVIAAWRGVELKDYLESLIAEPVERDYADHLREEAQSINGQ